VVARKLVTLIVAMTLAPLKTLWFYRISFLATRTLQ
jgi:hypothetical protein